MIGLTQAQAELLHFIRTYMDQNSGVAPSFEEMKEAVGLASKSGVHRLILALEERGFIRRLPNRTRALEVLDGHPPIEPLARYSSAQLVAELARRGETNRRAA